MKKCLLYLVAAALFTFTLSFSTSCSGDSEINERVAELWILIAEGELLSSSDHTTASWAPFMAALENAKSVVTHDSPTLEALKAAITNLKSTLLALVSKDMVREDLLTAITVSDVWENDGYTDASWTAFRGALDAAKRAYNDSGSTVDALDAALKNLLSTFDSLVKA